MSITGQPASSLNERLLSKLEQDRKQIEELTLSEHKKLAQSFLSASKAEFDTIKSAIQDQSQTTVRTLGEMLRWPLWTAAGCMVIVLTALVLLWAVTWWTRRDLSAIRTAISSERQTLSNLQDQTGGVRITKARNGTFVVLPSGSDLSKTFDCDGQACIRIGD